MKIPSKRMIGPIASAAMVLLGMAPVSKAVVLYSNDFSSDTSGNQPAGIYAYGGQGGAAAKIVSDNTAPLSRNALQFYSSSYNSFMIGSFSTASLVNAGDFVQLSADVRYTTVLGSTLNNTGPMLGLLYDGGTPLTANSFGSRGATADDVGYKASKQVNLGNSPVNANDFLILGQNTSDDFNTYGGLLQKTDSGLYLNNTSSHAMTIRLELQAGGDLLITAGLDGYSTSYTVAEKDVLSRSFNEFVIAGSGGLNSGIVDFDNLLVTTNVPEPSALALLPAGLILLTALGKRRMFSRKA